MHQHLFYTLQLSNQKQIQNWCTNRKLSHRVVYDFKSKKYVGIFDTRHLTCWDEAEEQISKGRIKVSLGLFHLQIEFIHRQLFFLVKENSG